MHALMQILSLSKHPTSRTMSMWVWVSSGFGLNHYPIRRICITHRNMGWNRNPLETILLIKNQGSTLIANRNSEITKKKKKNLPGEGKGNGKLTWGVSWEGIYSSLLSFPLLCTNSIISSIRILVSEGARERLKKQFYFIYQVVVELWMSVFWFWKRFSLSIFG